MPEPVHEGNLVDDAREQHIRTTQGRYHPDGTACTCPMCFLLRRLDEARAQLARLDDLFAGGPDTPCRTTWRGEDGFIGLALPPRVECVEVPMSDLREAFGGKTPTPDTTTPVRSSPPSRPREA